MKTSRTTPSWLRVACATVAASALCYPIGIVAELVWANWFVAFGALMLLALVTMEFHPWSRRVVGVPVEQDRFTAP